MAAISGGKFDVPHFTGKAEIDRIVQEAGLAHHTFVIAPFYYQALVGALAPHKQADGSVGWALPLDPTVRVIHMGDITKLGNIVAGAFAHPDKAGNGEYLPLVGDSRSKRWWIGCAKAHQLNSPRSDRRWSVLRFGGTALSNHRAFLLTATARARLPIATGGPFLLTRTDAAVVRTTPSPLISVSDCETGRLQARKQLAATHEAD